MLDFSFETWEKEMYFILGWAWCQTSLKRRDSCSRRQMRIRGVRPGRRWRKSLISLISKIVHRFISKTNQKISNSNSVYFDEKSVSSRNKNFDISVIILTKNILKCHKRIIFIQFNSFQIRSVLSSDADVVEANAWRQQTCLEKGLQGITF